MIIPEIETERLLLREFREQDLNSYAEICSNKLFRQYLGNGKILSREETWESMSSSLGHWHLRGYGIWALERKLNNSLIGHVGLLNPEGWPGVELCWALSPEYWGNGYATEAAKETICWAFTHLKIDSLISLIYPDNNASIKVSNRIGQKFQKEIQFFDSTLYMYSINRLDT